MDAKTIHFLEMPNGKSKAYLHYDTERGGVTYRGTFHPIPEDKFIDFLHTANEIGLRAGMV